MKIPVPSGTNKAPKDVFKDNVAETILPSSSIIEK